VPPWLIVTGDFTTQGGMDSANYGLARYVARRQQGDVHLVAHAVAPDLAALPGVHVHAAPRPLGSHRLGEPLLRSAARRWASRLRRRGGRILINGGNADEGDVTWVHHVHAAFEPHGVGAINGRRVGINHRRHVRLERAALLRARLVLCNSRRTADDVTRLLDVPRDRAAVVYYGTDPARYGPVSDRERDAAREALRIAPGRRVALFVGALGDRRKNFDTLLEAWILLSRRPSWDVDLFVAGCGAELAAWRARAAAALPSGRVRFLGFRRDIPAVLAACDLLVHPARYEAYGLAVHEALCRGIPAVVSASAGVAERFPPDLRCLLVDDPESAGEFAARLLDWRDDATVGRRVEALGATLRSRTWDHMGRDIVDLIEVGGRP
jgi:glycosyltransferase involved in cell wall biosynthesis